MFTKVFNLAIESLIKVRNQLSTENFSSIIKVILTKQMIWTSGVGKAGLAARKLSSTLASNHKPAAYLSASDALHGDLGAIKKDDCIIVLSNSGKTEEMLKILIKAREIGITTILITGNGSNILGREANYVLDYGKIKEACPLGLTPTTSYTVMIVLVDAIAMTMQEYNKLTYEQYSTSHHAGYLGELARQKEEIENNLDQARPVTPRSPDRTCKAEFYCFFRD
jgi:arabinose-5-phosphate isomerase